MADQIRARRSPHIARSRFNTEAKVERFPELFPQAVADLRPVITWAYAQKLKGNAWHDY